MSLFLIAEIGINHNGNIEIAKKLITQAKEAGFDAVKFQKEQSKKFTLKNFLIVRKVLGVKHREIKKRGIEFNFDDYKIIDNFCKSQNILWSASAWDVDSQIFLRKFDLKFNKVASPMMGNFPLLRKIAEERKKLLFQLACALLMK